MKPLNRLQPARVLQLAVAIALLSVSCEKDSRLAVKATDPASLKSKAATAIASPLISGWVQLADLPFPDGVSGDIPNGLVSPQGFAINGKGYLCGGMTITSFGQAEELKNLWEFNATTQAWTQKASFPGSTPDAGTNFVVGNNAYVIVGNSNWQYHQPTNTWTAKTSLPGKPRDHASAFSIGSTGFVGLGFDLTTGIDDLRDFWQYFPGTDTWRRRRPFPDKREGAMSFVVNGKGYICSGGHFTNPGTTYFSDLWQYEPVADAWVSKAAFPAAGRMHGVGFGEAANGFAGTGSNGSGFYADFWKYTPASNSWSSEPAIGSARDQAGPFRIGNNLYVAGGTAGLDGMKDFWMFHL